MRSATTAIIFVRVAVRVDFGIQIYSGNWVAALWSTDPCQLKTIASFVPDSGPGRFGVNLHRPVDFGPVCTPGLTAGLREPTWQNDAFWKTRIFFAAHRRRLPGGQTVVPAVAGMVVAVSAVSVRYFGLRTKIFG